ncbi:MAG: anhydro-N-acetylmuramic acid kinase [Magnetococcales bacterium]|nr:anhydro-N-acetylmuramic acid kinase [Magnetococcales bacterium]
MTHFYELDHQPVLAIGLMSGTSADAIDAVVVRTDGISAPEQLASLALPYPAAVRQQILELYEPQATTWQGDSEIDRMGDLDQQLGELFAAAALAVLAAAELTPAQVAVIGSHGQTIRHRPPVFTLQIGSGFVIRARTGITTVANFRPTDIAHGGSGAPLTPRFHRTLFQHHGQSTAVVNFGGITNITALPADLAAPLQAGDSGPANSLIDLLSTWLGYGPYDRDAIHTCQGQVMPQALLWLKSHPYFTQPFPKSTGRELFGATFLQQFLDQFPRAASNDGLATLTQLTIETTADACRQLLPPAPQQLILCGGGSANPAITRGLKQALPDSNIQLSSSYGVDPHALEAQAFAWFAVRTLRGLPSSLPQATGATSESVLGAIFI